MAAFHSFDYKSSVLCSVLPAASPQCRALEGIEANHTQVKIPLDLPDRFAADTSFASKPEGVAYSAEMCQRRNDHEWRASRVLRSS